MKQIFITVIVGLSLIFTISCFDAKSDSTQVQTKKTNRFGKALPSISEDEKSEMIALMTDLIATQNYSRYVEAFKSGQEIAPDDFWDISTEMKASLQKCERKVEPVEFEIDGHKYYVGHTTINGEQCPISVLDQPRPLKHIETDVEVIDQGKGSYEFELNPVAAARESNRILGYNGKAETLAKIKIEEKRVVLSQSSEWRGDVSIEGMNTSSYQLSDSASLGLKNGNQADSILLLTIVNINLKGKEYELYAKMTASDGEEPSVEVYLNGEKLISLEKISSQLKMHKNYMQKILQKRYLTYIK